MTDSYGARSSLEVAGREYEIHRLDALQSKYDVARLPYSLKVLLENCLRLEDGVGVTADDIETIATWNAKAEPTEEIPFQPARVLMQDFTGVPAVVDLAAMRDAMDELGSDPAKINPLVPVDLVIDHSVQVDAFGNARAFEVNAEREFERNEERYEFLRWGQKAFDNFRVVPPATGICHQVNLEYLGRVVWSDTRDGVDRAFPDTLVGTDSHTTMINGLSVLGWGVGGIEAEAAMLGQPISMLLPQVIGFRLDGELGDATTATDLVLRVTEMLRERGVVSKFVEFYGPGLPSLGLADRATLGNMSPEFGSTCAIFPPDAETLRYLEFTGRGSEVIELVDAYTREQGMFHEPDSEEPTFSDTLELDLGDVVPAIAGPKRPQDRIALTDAKGAFFETLRSFNDEAASALGTEREPDTGSFPASDPPGNGSETATGSPTDSPEGAPAATAVAGERCSDDSIEVTDSEGNEFDLDHGRVVIAAITSCTNTSNPSVMIGAGLLAKKAVERGLDVKPWVKTSLAPGSTVVTDYLEKSGLDEYLNRLKFDLVGYGCTTCIGNSGPLDEHDLRGGGGEGPRRLRRALGQPQLRGPDQPGRQGQLPRIAAALRRLRARRPDGLRLRVRAARHRQRRRAGLPARRLAERRGDPRHGRRRRPGRHVREELRERLRGRRALEGDQGARRRPLQLARLDLRPPPAVLRGDGPGAGGSRRTRSPAPASSPSSATRSRPTTSRPPARSRRTARPDAG